jgi:hypothetical protein
MAYWLFPGNPKYYRILDALNDREELPSPSERAMILALPVKPLKMNTARALNSEH